MTLAAFGRKPVRLMIRSLRFAEDIQMTAHTLGREAKTVELPNSANFMARVTIDYGVRPDQRKSILVLVNVVNRDLPAIWVVAQLALRPIFATMKIGVAVLTFFWHMAEHEIGVTIDALNFRVASAQLEPGLRMLELHFLAKRSPSLLVVTLLAGNIELLAVRTLSTRTRIFFLCTADRCRQKEHE